MGGGLGRGATTPSPAAPEGAGLSSVTPDARTAAALPVCRGFVRPRGRRDDPRSGARAGCDLFSVIVPDGGPGGQPEHGHGRDRRDDSHEGGGRLVGEPADGDPGQPPGRSRGDAPPRSGAGHDDRRDHDDDGDDEGCDQLAHQGRGLDTLRHEGGGDVGARRHRDPAQVEAEGAVDHDALHEGGSGAEVGQALDEHAEDDDEGQDHHDARPQPALLGDQQPAGVQHHGGGSEPPGAAGARVGARGGQPLPERVGGQSGVHHRPDREGRTERGEQGGVGGERAARALRDAGADDADADERADDAEHLGDRDADLAAAVGSGRCGCGGALRGGHPAIQQDVG